MQMNPTINKEWMQGNVSVGGSIVALPSDYNELLIHVSSSDYNNATFYLTKDVVTATNKIFTVRGVNQAIISLLINSNAFAITQSTEPDGTDTTSSVVARLYYR